MNLLRPRLHVQKEFFAPVLERLANEKADRIDATDGVKL